MRIAESAKDSPSKYKAAAGEKINEITPVMAGPASRPSRGAAKNSELYRALTVSPSELAILPSKTIRAVSPGLSKQERSAIKTKRTERGSA
jgi:hypothetical protein